MEQRVALEMRGINKDFPGVKTLQDMDFTLGEGEIYALMGEDDTGKPTLIKVLTGVEEFETGTIRMEESYNIITNRLPQEAQENSISTVYQEANLCPNLSMVENLYTGREPRKGSMTDWRAVKEDARGPLEGLGIHADVTIVAESYSIAIQQVIIIARAVDMSARALILDEPTPSLDGGEVEKLFVPMRQLRAKGIEIIFVAHFLEQVYATCNRITVLRNGTLAGEFKMEELPGVQLVTKMIDKDLDDLATIKKEGMSMVKEDVVISARELGCREAIKPFSLDIHKGEVIGPTGFLGPDRSELVRAIYGVDKPDSGEPAIKGEKLKVDAPIDTMMEDTAYLPENRKEEGVIADLSVRENIIITLQAKKGMFELMNREEQEEFMDKYIDIFQVKTADRETPTKQLPDGDQQKVILGRWLLTDPDFLILDEPTRGVNIGTKTEIQKLVLRLAEEGMTVAFISSETEEMLRTCSRMAVMRDGEKVGELREDELGQNSIMRAIARGEEERWGSLKS